MKKQYTTPALDVVFLVSTEIVTESTLTVNQTTSANGGLMYGKSRNPIWEEDE